MSKKHHSIVKKTQSSSTGYAEFEVKLVEKLPKELKSSLPTVEQIEAELSVIPTKKTTQKKRHNP